MNLARGEGLERSLNRLYLSTKAWGKMLFLSAKGLKLPKAEGEELYILASGPSTSAFLAEHSHWLKDKTLLVVNHFPKTEAFAELKPRYLLGMNREFWEYQAGEERYAKYTELYAALEQKTDWPLTFLLPARARKRIKPGFFQNQHLGHAYWNKNGMEGHMGLLFRLWRNNLGSPRCWNSMVAALYCGLTMGYKRVYLIGADHNWPQELRVDQNNRTLLRKVHFYENREQVALEPFVHSETGKHLSVAELLHSWSVVFGSYHLLADYARHLGAEVVNLNPESYIDAFPKESIP